MDNLTPEDITAVHQDGTVLYTAKTSMADLTNARDSAKDALDALRQDQTRLHLEADALDPQIVEAQTVLDAADIILAAALAKQ